MSLNIAISEQTIINKNDKVYVSNLKVMLASDLFDKKTGTYTKIRGCKNPPPNGWMVSEKWDGIRAIWDGEKFISRGSFSGLPKVYSYVPKWFVDIMPKDIPLDGEFWIGRGLFNKVSALSNLLPGSKYTQEELDDLWSGKLTDMPVKFKIFDVPLMYDSFQNRYEFLKTLIPSIKNNYTGTNKFPLVLSKQLFVKNEEHLYQIYNAVLEKGGEGLILKNPLSYYEGKRSKNMLKMKINNDAEAIVQEHVPGTGRLSGMIGSLKAEIIKDGVLTGIKVSIGTGLTDEHRTYDVNSKNYIPIGSIISFSYMEMTKDTVRHPVYKGIRSDIKIKK